jgi:long-chain acyl-CoA synthetase
MFQRFMDLAQARRPGADGRQPVGFARPLLYALGDLLVYGPLRNNLGFSRVRVAYTAGEAIGPDLFTFYRSIGINLKQLYGSTETAVFVCLQPDNQVRADTVGMPIRASRSRWPTTARSWCARPACSRATTRTRRPPPKC